MSSVEVKEVMEAVRRPCQYRRSRRGLENDIVPATPTRTGRVRHVAYNAALSLSALLKGGALDDARWW